MKPEETIVLFFTKEEARILKSALNSYAVDMMNKSKTWATPGSFGNEDIWHIEANNANKIWSRLFEAVIEDVSK